MPLPPSLSPDQRQAALAKAAAARRQRAELKEKLKMGSTSLKELLEQADRDEIVGKMKVLSVLESLPGVGKVKARRLMEEVGISETRRGQGLGDKQRKSLFEKLEGTSYPVLARRHLRARRGRQGHVGPAPRRRRRSALAEPIVDHPPAAPPRAGGRLRLRRPRRVRGQRRERRVPRDEPVRGQWPLVRHPVAG